MTTIACDHELMAADSKITYGDTSFGTRKKILRVAGKLVGVAGYDFYTTQFLDMLRRGEYTQLVRRDQDLELDDIGFEALVLDDSGITLIDDTLTQVKVEGKFFAIGSGAVAARAAMMMGADPKKAVKVAAQLDNGTGLPVVSMTLKRKSGARNPSNKHPV